MKPSTLKSGPYKGRLEREVKRAGATRALRESRVHRVPSRSLRVVIALSPMHECVTIMMG